MNLTLTASFQTEYHLTRRRRLKLSHLFVPNTSSDYWYQSQFILLTYPVDVFIQGFGMESIGGPQLPGLSYVIDFSTKQILLTESSGCLSHHAWVRWLCQPSRESERGMDVSSKLIARLRKPPRMTHLESGTSITCLGSWVFSSVESRG